MILFYLHQACVYYFWWINLYLFVLLLLAIQYMHKFICIFFLCLNLVHTHKICLQSVWSKKKHSKYALQILNALLQSLRRNLCCVFTYLNVRCVNFISFICLLHWFGCWIYLWFIIIDQFCIHILAMFMFSHHFGPSMQWMAHDLHWLTDFYFICDFFFSFSLSLSLDLTSYIWFYMMCELHI